MDLIGTIFSFIVNYSLSIITLIFLLGLAVVYISDRSQNSQTIRRNYPLIGRFRYFFEEIGVFFRQYFFADDREEMPFNRADRSWVYRASKQESTLQAFGSTRQQHEGDVLFSNSMFPNTQQNESTSLVFGPFTANPYSTDRVFHVSGMSYGAISKPAIKALVNGAQQAGVWINTGEGGASDEHLKGGADIVFQIGTAKYGVRNLDGTLSETKLRAMAEYNNVRMFEIKLSQGAKPGKGGILPADKVNAEIAKQRGIPEGQASISPPSHAEITSFETLFDFIHKVRSITEKPVGIKMCVGDIGEFKSMLNALIQRAENLSLIAESNKTKQEQFEKALADFAPDFITLDGGNGGTGAAPMSLIDAAGMNLQQSLPLVSNALVEFNLKDRIKLVCSGKLITPVDVAWALCAGADAVTTARGFMFSLGCIQALHCHKNTCPTGITTQDKRLQNGLVSSNKEKRVAAYANEMHKELESIARSCGVSSPTLLSRRNAMIYINNQQALPMTEVYK